MRRVITASLLAAACSGTVRSSTSTIRDDGTGVTAKGSDCSVGVDGGR